MDVVAEAKVKIEQALAGLDQERKKLERALVSLDGGKPALLSSAGARPSKRSKKRASRGQRREQFLAALKEKPGITVTEAARRIGVSPPNALYTLAKRLTKEGVVVKKGAGYTITKESATPKVAKAKSPAKRKRASKKGSKKPRRKLGS